MLNKICSKNSSDKPRITRSIDPAIASFIIEIGQQLLAESEANTVLTQAMDRAIEKIGVEHGMIIFFDENGEQVFETARDSNKSDITHPESVVSYKIINEVRTRGEPLCLNDGSNNTMFGNSRSTSQLNTGSIICLPLIYDEKLFGVIYMDNRSTKRVFTRSNFNFVEAFVDFISLAAYNTHLKKRGVEKKNGLEAELRSRYHFESIIGQHPRMIEILQLVTQIADTDAVVLIQGESGTGKELIARALHFNSRRQEKPFVPINCGALPENLLETELFGHVRGAFTGASHDKPGWFERANGGTIFLDEVSEMSPNLQVKLLRILQTGEYSHVGDARIFHCNVRIVAATNRNLQTLVNKGTFREDLYYRLNVIDLLIPPLRERTSDIPLLINHFLKEYGKKYNKNDLKISYKAESILLTFDYPGNCRELQNIIQHAVVICNGKYIQPHHLPARILPQKSNGSNSWHPSSFKLAKQVVIEKFEHDFIIDCLKVNRGNVTRAAKMAGINVKNFYLKMKKYCIESLPFKLNGRK